MIERPSETIIDAWIALMRAQQAALLKIERRLRAADLPPLTWYDVLWELERAGTAGLRPFEIERQVLIAQSNISRLIDRLEKKGHVQRLPCAEDGRGQIVAITSTGLALRKRMWPVYAAAITETVGQHLSEDEAAQVTALLARFSGAEP